MLFDEEFLSNLPEEPLPAIMDICSALIEFDNLYDPVDRIKNYDTYLEAYALIKSYSESFGVPLPVDIPSLEDNEAENIKRILAYFSKLRTIVLRQAVLIKTNITIEKSRAIFDGHFGKATVYEFSDGDIQRIQELITELRNEITKSDILDENHRSRLLKRLEKLQSELHKKVSSLDVFWGVLGDAGVAIGRFGNDVKPIVERFNEIMQIVWRVQARTGELQSGAKNLLLQEGLSDKEK